MTVYLIQRVGVVSEGLGRDRLNATLLPDFGYFTSEQEAEPTLTRLNAPAVAEYERQEAARRERHVDPDSTYERVGIEYYDRIPQFSLRPIGSGVDIEAVLTSTQAAAERS